MVKKRHLLEMFSVEGHPNTGAGYEERLRNCHLWKFWKLLVLVLLVCMLEKDV